MVDKNNLACTFREIERRAAWLDSNQPCSPAEVELAAMIEQLCALLRHVLCDSTSGIEARSDETRSGSAVGESPVAQPDAHNIQGNQSHD